MKKTHVKVTLDTNVLARVMVDDSTAPAQCAAARKALAAATAVFVPQVVQIELCWILETAFGLRHAEVASVLRALQSTPRVELEHRPSFDAALAQFATDAAWGFADAMIAAAAAKQQTTLLTFDKKLARLSGTAVLR